MNGLRPKGRRNHTRSKRSTDQASACKTRVKSSSAKVP